MVSPFPPTSLPITAKNLAKLEKVDFAIQASDGAVAAILRLEQMITNARQEVLGISPVALNDFSIDHQGVGGTTTKGESNVTDELHDEIDKLQRAFGG